MLCFVRLFHEKAADFLPNVLAVEAVVVQSVGQAVNRDAYFFDVGVEIIFRVPGTRSVRLNAKKKNSF